MKVGIVGTGQVGSSAAFAMVMKGIGRELVLIDVNKDRAQAEASDLLHAVPYASPIKIIAGDYTDLKGSRAVVVSAGIPRKPGQSRLDLTKQNARIMRGIVHEIIDHAPEAVIVVATNPVDVMTHLAGRYADEKGVPSYKIIGSGTSLDTARFRALLGDHVGVSSRHIHAYVIGEHGDSVVFPWSLVSVGGMPLFDFCRANNIKIGQNTLTKIDDKIRYAGASIIKGKGATYYGIGSALANIVDVILKDQRAVLTVGTPTKEIVGVKNVTISLPHLVGEDGILATFPPNLNKEEETALHESAMVVSSAIETFDKSDG